MDQRTRRATTLFIIMVAGLVMFIATFAPYALGVLGWAFAAEVGESTLGQGIAPITLAYNVTEDAEVDAVLDEIAAAGGTVVERGTRRAWGGYSGYATDPDGYRWEIANAGRGPLSDIVVPAPPPPF